MDWIIRFLVISGLVIIALLLFQCIPVEESWSLQLGTICAQCMPFSVSVYVSASRNILTDIFLIAFATPGVRKYILVFLTLGATNILINTSLSQCL
jgi:hypothetical protein